MRVRDTAVWICPACHKEVDEYRPKCWFCGHSGEGVARGPVSAWSWGPKRASPTQGERLVLAAGLGVCATLLVIPLILVWTAAALGGSNPGWITPFVFALVFGVLAAVAGGMQLLMNVRQGIGMRMAAGAAVGMFAGLWVAYFRAQQGALLLFAVAFIGGFTGAALGGYRRTPGEPSRDA